MYAWLWRNLPGPVPARLVQVAILAAAAVALCFGWLFPAAAPYLPFNQLTVEEIP